MFQITSTAIEEDMEALRQSVEHPEAGAYASFEGWVRNHNEGQSVEKLAYEAYESLAKLEGQRIIQEALDKFQIKKARCIHRVGTLTIGEMAVWVGATSSHRDEAFKACRYIIDEIKTRLPIWKKEFYINKPAEWVNCQACAKHVHQKHHEDSALSENDYYARQSSLAELGNSGQDKLRNSRVLVVGAGGLGCPALLYLAGAGIGSLGICDPDELQADNLHRQILYTAQDIGQSKAELAARQLKKLNPFIQINVHAEALTALNVESLFDNYDWILDCTDNFKTKFLINDASVLFKKKLIQASIYQYEGQIQLYHPDENTACLRCHWPKIPEEGCVGTCSEVGVLGAVPGVLGTMQALEAVKQIVGLKSPLYQHMLLMDLLSYQTTSLQRKKNPSCPLCGLAPKITEIEVRNYEKENFENDFEIDLSTLSMEKSKNYEWLDIRDMSELPPAHSFVKETNYLLFCNKGIRSLVMVKALREQGVKNVYSVPKGYPAVAQFKEQNNAQTEKAFMS